MKLLALAFLAFGFVTGSAAQNDLSTCYFEGYLWPTTDDGVCCVPRERIASAIYSGGRSRWSRRLDLASDVFDRFTPWPASHPDRADFCAHVCQLCFETATSNITGLCGCFYMEDVDPEDLQKYFPLCVCHDDGTGDPFQPYATPQTVAGAFGDPHFMTWAGHAYDFHGGCDLVLIKAPNFAETLGLDIHVRTKVRYEYSYIESAAVKIGSDIMEVDSFGDYALNGVSNAALPASMVESRAYVTHSVASENRHDFNITLPDGIEIMMASFKDMVSVKILGGGTQFEASVGLLGNYDAEGAMLARDGVTLLKEDANAFGAEWQVHSDEPHLFLTARSPQFPEACVMPNQRTKTARRLGESIDKEVAEEACDHWGAKKDNCVFDVMATRDLDLAKEKPF